MPAGPRRQLTLLDTTCITVGIIIGAGIYRTSPAVAANVSGPISLMSLWVLGGLAALIGALCYAELATAYPHEGGDYVFLRKAYGRPMGFLFAWAEFWIIRPGNIGAMGFVLARYATELVDPGFGRWNAVAYTCATTVILTIINVLGVRSGKWTQNVLTVVKVLGLAAIFAVALLAEPAPRIAPVEASEPRDASLYVACILVLFTYGGWNDMVYVAAEVQRPEKNILRALVLGTLTVMLIYVAVNAAFLYALGFEGLARSPAVAAQLLQRSLGSWGSRAISALICISCLGAMNGMIFTSGRIYYALGREHRWYRWLGHWHQRLDAPVRSLVLQAVATLVLVIGLGGRSDAFDQLVTLAAPFVWFFFLLTGIALFVLRRRDPMAQRSYRVHFYPVTPLLFCASSLFLLYASVAYLAEQDRGVTVERTFAVGVVIVGLLLCRKSGERTV